MTATPRRTSYRPSLVRSDYFVIRTLERFVASTLREHTRPGIRVLDVGCGEQPWQPLVEALGAHYVGADAHQNAAGTVALRCAADALALQSHSAELALCTEVLEHVPDPGRALVEVRRVLRPDGIALVTTPFLYPLHEQPRDFQRLTRYQLDRLARQAGFSVVSLTVAGNEVEVWATLWDRLWSDLLSRRLGRARTAALAGARAPVNLIAAVLSALVGRWCPQSAYLANLAVLRATAA